MLNLSKFQWIWVNLNEIKTFRYKNNNNNNKKTAKTMRICAYFQKKNNCNVMKSSDLTHEKCSLSEHEMNRNYRGQHRKSNNLSGQCALHNIFIHLCVCVLSLLLWGLLFRVRLQHWIGWWHRTGKVWSLLARTQHRNS